MVDDATHTTPEELARLSAEVDALRAERDELLSKDGRRREPGTMRRLLVGLLVVLAVVSTIAAGVGIFAHRNLLDTDRWVSRVGPLAEDPAVSAAISARLTQEVMRLVDPEALLADALPERGQILAGPLANAVEGFVAERVSAFVGSEDFQQLWVAANEQAHAAAVRLLRGESDNVVAQDGMVRIDLLPIVTAVLARIGERSPELLGREIDLPTLTVDDLPGPAIARIEARLGVDLGDDFGQITVYDDGQLEAAQDAVRTIDRAITLLVVVAVVATGAALWLSRRRRRTLLQLAGGVVVGLVIVRRVTFRLEDEVVDLARVDENRPAVQAVVDAFVDPFLTGTRWLLAIAAIVAVLAVATASYPWVVSARRRAGALARSGASALGTARGRAGDDETVRWIVERRGLVQAAVAASGLVALWAFDLSWLGLVLVLAVVAALELWLFRLELRDSPTWG